MTEDFLAIPADAVLSVEDLRVHFHTDSGVVKAVDGISWYVRPGETLGIVGESGSGKSVSAMSVMGLVPSPPARYPSGSIKLMGQELLHAPADVLRSVRGKDVSMIFQDPLTSLNPVFKVGVQIAEAIRVHEKLGRIPAKARAIELLAEVGIPNPRQRADEYPHQFSGGMRQRAMIAMAIALNPAVLLADEPSTALDVTVQAQIMELLEQLQADRNMAIVLITHDLGLVAHHADRVLVMYAGRAAETAVTDDVFYRPRHGYTRGLLGSLARLDERQAIRLEPITGHPPSLIDVPPGCPFHPRCRFATEICHLQVPTLVATPNGHADACHNRDAVLAAGSPTLAPVVLGPRAPLANVEHAPLLVVKDLTKHFPVTAGVLLKRRVGSVKAVDGISFTVNVGQTLALVGESGCGKSTTARAVLRLLEPTSGSVRFDGTEVTGLHAGPLRELRRDMQMVFQDPFASLNPRMTVRNILSEPFRVHGIDEPDPVPLLERVGLDREHLGRYPHEFSGGQRQRIGIARAISLNPRLVVCDEPVSALDVSIQAQVLNLMEDIQEDLGLTYLFIAHDLSVVRHLADEVAVMYLGTIVEQADTNDLFERPAHPYTQALISAVPIPDPVKERSRQRIILEGDVPSPANPPSGCPFRTRCQLFTELGGDDQQRCVHERPALVDRGNGHPVACHFARVEAVV